MRKACTAETGIIYRNSLPHIVSRHAYFPSLVLLPDGMLAASFVIAEAFEAVNADTYISLSKDMGKTWTEPSPILPEEYKQSFSNCARLTAVGQREVVAMVVRSDRAAHPGEGLANPENMGFVPTDLMLVRSADGGERWGRPEVIVPPLVGPSFEACSPLVVLRDGRWIWPTSTWRGWDGYCPNGMKMVALVSHDEGRSWPEYMDVMDGSKDNIIFWESKMVELGDGGLVAAAWTYDEKKGCDLPIHYTVSHDGGQRWTKPASTGITGQTIVLIADGEGRVVSVYRRMDQPGLWLSVSVLEGDKWSNIYECCLWGGLDSRLTQKADNMVKEFNELKFGAPSIIRLPDDTLFVAFWCYEGMVSHIRWFKLKLAA